MTADEGCDRMTGSSEQTRGHAPVLLVRAAGGDDRDAEALRDLGLHVVEDPYLVVAPCADADARRRAERVLAAIADEADLLLLTSRAAIRALDALVGREALTDAVALGVQRGLRGAAVGPSTAAALRALGVQEVVEPAVATSRGLLAALREDPAPAGRAVLPCGAKAMKGLGAGLGEDGWHVEEIVVYTTEEVAQVPASVTALSDGHIGALVLRSPTAVRAVARFVGQLPTGTVPVCGGPTTAAAVRETWHIEPVVSSGPTAEEVARTVQRVIGDQQDGAEVTG